MTAKVFRARFEATVSADVESRSIDVVASSPALDSAGRIVIQDWDLARFTANPVVLWNHGFGGGFLGAGSDDLTLPIGRASDVRVEDGLLKAKLHFVDARANPIAEKVFQGFAQGSIRSVSIGWTAKKRERATLEDGTEAIVLSGNELHEISAVAIPANAEAVKQSAAMFASLLAADELEETEMVLEQKKDSASLLAALGASTADEALGVIAGLKARADMAEGMQASVDGLKAKVAELEKKEVDAERTRLIEQARAEGKFVPSNEGALLEVAGDSVDRLRGLVKALPVVANMQEARTPPNQEQPELDLSPSERSRLKKAGLNEAAYIERKKKILSEKESH